MAAEGASLSPPLERPRRARDSHRVPGAPADAGGRGAAPLPFLAPGPVALVDLIERHGGFDWREAVAVIHQICQYLKEHPPHTPILLDPRNIQITDNGEVHLLSGQTSSDPLVIQVGRLLRTMLMGKEAPPELRLLLAQATFELPIFESIEDVDRALAQLNKLDEPGPAGLALLRAVAAPPPPPNTEDEAAYRPPAIRSILPARARSRTPDALEDDADSGRCWAATRCTWRSSSSGSRPLARSSLTRPALFLMPTHRHREPAPARIANGARDATPDAATSGTGGARSEARRAHCRRSRANQRGRRRQRVQPPPTVAPPPAQSNRARTATVTAPTREPHRRAAITRRPLSNGAASCRNRGHRASAALAARLRAASHVAPRTGTDSRGVAWRSIRS